CAGHGMLCEPGVESSEIECEVLDARASELDVREAEALRHDRSGASGESEHLVVQVDTDHPSLRSRELSGDEADLPAAAPEAEDAVPLAHVARRVPTPVVALEHVVRDHAQVLRIVIDRAAERRLSPSRGGRVALAHSSLRIGLTDSLLHASPPSVVLRWDPGDGYATRGLLNE